MSTATILRPDSRNRIGLGNLIQECETILGFAVSGFKAEVHPDGSITLKPRLEFDADATMSLPNKDRDALLKALEHPVLPARMQEALRHLQNCHTKTIQGQAL